MNAADTIAAAIEKLEALKVDSHPGPWEHWPEAGDIEIHVPSYPDGERIIATAVRPRGGWGAPIYQDNYEPNADLIVTLHRTIDAQLTILRTGKQFAEITPNTFTRVALDLALAILGES